MADNLNIFTASKLHGPAITKAGCSVTNGMCISVISLCLLISGCAISPGPSKSNEDGDLSTADRLAAIEIRLGSIDAKLAIIQAYETGIYVVRAGDTAIKIGQLFGIQSADLKRLNPAVQWNRLRIGQQIRIRENLPNKIATHESPVPASSPGAPAHRTLDPLPAAVGEPDCR